MAAWNFERFQRSIESGAIGNLYCLYGEEAFLVEEAVKDLVERGLEGAPRDFNVDVFYGSEASASQVKDAIEMLPMMASKRIVILKGADSLKARDFEELLSVVESPIDSTLFLVVAEKVDQRKKFFKAMEKNGALVKMDRVRDEHLPQWISKLAQAEGKKLTPQASLLLIQMVGASLLDLRNEIQKVSQYVGAVETITEEHVRAVVTHSRLESIFELTNAVGERDRARALTFLAQLLDHGESEVGILALISRHMRILRNSKEAVASGLSKPQIAAKVGVPIFFVQDYLSQASRWTTDQLEKAYEACLETDRALKSSPVSSHIWLENFVLQMTRD